MKNSQSIAVENRGFNSANFVELNEAELKEIRGGWVFKALRVVAVAAAAIHEVIHDDVCVGGDEGEPSDWASSACEGCQA